MKHTSIMQYDAKYSYHDVNDDMMTKDSFNGRVRA